MTSVPSKIEANQSVKKACQFLMAAFSQGQEPRERSPQKDPVPASHPVGGPNTLSLPFLSRGSKSTPASPNRPLVEEQLSMASSLNTLFQLMDVDHMVLPPYHCNNSSMQDAQGPFSPSQDEMVLHKPISGSPPSSFDNSQPSNLSQPGHLNLDNQGHLDKQNVDQSGEALKRAPISSISPQELVDFTDSLFQEVHPTMVDQLPHPQLASLQCSFRYLDQSISELTKPVEDSQQSHLDTINENAPWVRKLTWNVPSTMRPQNFTMTFHI